MFRMRLFERGLILAALVLAGIFAGSVFSVEAGAPMTIQAPTSPEGFLMGAEVEISPQLTPTDPDRYHPSAAYNYNRSQYLVVWHNMWASGHDREVIGQRVDASGHLVGLNFPISSGPSDRTQPAVAYNGTDDEYMVVWMYDVNDNGQKYEIWGVRVNWNGTLLDAPFLIESVTNSTAWSPEIAWNPILNEYAVVWGAMTQDTQTPTAIGTKVIDSDGSLIYGTVISSDGFPTNPDITFDPVNHNYLVVWNYLNTSGKYVIKGDLRNQLYNRVRLVDIFGSTTNHALLPRVDSSMGLFFMVTFAYENAVNDHDIYVAYINADATSAFSAALVSGTTHDLYPDIAGSQRKFEFMVAYQRADVNGAKVLLRPVSSYLPVDQDIEICNYFSTDCLNPTVIPGGGGYFHGYLIDTPISVLETRQHVFGRIFNDQLIYLPLIMR